MLLQSPQPQQQPQKTEETNRETDMLVMNSFSKCWIISIFIPFTLFRHWLHLILNVALNKCKMIGGVVECARPGICRKWKQNKKMEKERTMLNCMRTVCDSRARVQFCLRAPCVCNFCGHTSQNIRVHWYECSAIIRFWFVLAIALIFLRSFQHLSFSLGLSPFYLRVSNSK